MQYFVMLEISCRWGCQLDALTELVKFLNKAQILISDYGNILLKKRRPTQVNYWSDIRRRPEIISSLFIPIILHQHCVGPQNSLLAQFNFSFRKVRLESYEITMSLQSREQIAKYQNASYDLRLTIYKSYNPSETLA